MTYQDKMLKIKDCLEHSVWPVLKPTEIAKITGLTYRQVVNTLRQQQQRANLSPFEYAEFDSIGSQYQTYWFSWSRCKRLPTS